jgi:genome maintenance exonuclease 1|tara:strand:+ start:975 stop:1646 length:672 start_codon:yes stop_codon:yes gene_type:complete
MFKHLDYLKEEVDLEAEMIEGTRFYRVPSGKMYPSITSVTSFYGRQKFVEWRKKVGNEEADRITRLATTRGTKFHDLVEKYMLNENVDDYKPLPTTKFLFLKAKPYLDRINNIHALEKSLYSDYLGLAGRVDCIAEYEGELAIIDFKTSKKIKPEKWIENYFVQEVAYACMYYEMTGIPVQKLITIMVAENGECFVYEKRNKDYYIKLLTKYIREFVSHHTED